MNEKAERSDRDDADGFTLRSVMVVCSGQSRVVTVAVYVGVCTDEPWS